MSPIPPAPAHAFDLPLPRSVRGAPAELRRAIRRKQNSESARRCRARRRLARLAPESDTSSPFPPHASASASDRQRIIQLEAAVRHLSQQLAQAQAQYASLLPLAVNPSPVVNEQEDFLNTIDRLAEL